MLLGAELLHVADADDRGAGVAQRPVGPRLARRGGRQHFGGAEALCPPGQRPLVLDHDRDAVQRARGGGVEHLAGALGEGLDDSVERRVALLDPGQGFVEQLGRGRPRRRRPPPPARAAGGRSRSTCRRPGEVGAALGLDLADVEGEQLEDRAARRTRARPPSRPARPRRPRSPSEASPAAMNSSAPVARSSISAGNPTEAPWPGSCRTASRGHSPGGEGRIPAATRA